MKVLIVLDDVDRRFNLTELIGELDTDMKKIFQHLIRLSKFQSCVDGKFSCFSPVIQMQISVLLMNLPLKLNTSKVAVWTEKLMISYEALDAPQKQMFLDIACSVNGEDLRIASNMWHEFSTSHLSGGSEYRHLLSLIKIGDDNELWMHDELRELGRQLLACQGGDTDFQMEIKPQTTNK
ncbi:uncharacterized protein LOC116200333 [Punica granatum]|uniref:Uncharacterized protein LOC116200333 n=1 Tax=Punica granatum TaxID=22663 RepID=A0A6P8D6U4_PUNGR|nr:uncharacterized protein LOC116200333 [Punica granatum]